MCASHATLSRRVLGMLADALAILQMRRDAFDHGRIFIAGNDLRLPATCLAGLDDCLEHAL